MEGYLFTIHFLEGLYSFPKPTSFLKLQAQTTPERAESGHQGYPAIRAGHRDIALGKEVIAFRVCLPSAKSKAGKGLVYSQMEIGVEEIKRLAKTIHSRNCDPTDPLVARV